MPQLSKPRFYHGFLWFFDAIVSKLGLFRWFSLLFQRLNPQNLGFPAVFFVFSSFCFQRLVFSFGFLLFFNVCIPKTPVLLLLSLVLQGPAPQSIAIPEVFCWFSRSESPKLKFFQCATWLFKVWMLKTKVVLDLSRSGAKELWLISIRIITHRII